MHRRNFLQVLGGLSLLSGVSCKNKLIPVKSDDSMIQHRLEMDSWCLRIGDRVRNKKIGLPMMGEVDKIVEPGSQMFALFKMLYYNEKNRSCLWDKYPNWTENKMLYIKLDYPIKACTREEFMKYHASFLNGEINIKYEETEDHTTMWYPEEDLVHVI